MPAETHIENSYDVVLVVQEVLKEQGLAVSDIDMLIPHQANLRINEMVAKLFRIDESKVHNNIQKYGNTTAATIPLCLAEARALGKAKPGNLVCAVALAPALPGARR